MAALTPTQVGDYPVDCPKCGDPVACPVFVEPVEQEPGQVVLRAVVDVDPAREHLREKHGVRLSRPAAL